MMKSQRMRQTCGRIVQTFVTSFSLRSSNLVMASQTPTPACSLSTVPIIAYRLTSPLGRWSARNSLAASSEIHSTTDVPDCSMLFSSVA
jgi:hypothetical protein